MSDYSNEEVRSKIIEMLEDISGDDSVATIPDDDLFESDILDSMAAIELLVSIEDDLGVSIAPTEVPREEMNTLNKIVDRVCERL